MQLTLSEWFDEAHGQLCMHSDKYVSVRNGKVYSGRRCNPRDLNRLPYTEDELAQQAAFKAATQKRKLIYASETLKADWQARFREAVVGKKTTCCSLPGYIMNQAFGGHITDEGAYQA